VTTTAAARPGKASTTKTQVYRPNMGYQDPESNALLQFGQFGPRFPGAEIPSLLPTTKQPSRAYPRIVSEPQPYISPHRVREISSDLDSAFYMIGICLTHVLLVALVITTFGYSLD
jgi:hypothetical protein